MKVKNRTPHHLGTGFHTQNFTPFFKSVFPPLPTPATIPFPTLSPQLSQQNSWYLRRTTLKIPYFPYNRTPSAGQARMGIFAARRTKNKNFLHIKTTYVTFPKIFRGPNFQIRISVNTSYHILKSLQPQTKSYPIYHRQGSQLKLKPKTYL